MVLVPPCDIFYISKTMKLHLPNLLRHALLTCMTAVAGVLAPTLGTASFIGGVVAFAFAEQAAAEQGFITAPSTGGNFWSNDYSFAFMLTESQLDAFKEGTASQMVLAAYYGSDSANAYGANAWVLEKDADGNVILKVGRGKLSSQNIEEATFTFKDNKVFSQGVQAGLIYRADCAGGNQSMRPSLSAVAGSGTLASLDAYAGNMNGYTQAMTSKTNASVFPNLEDLVWSGAGDSAEWGSWVTVAGESASDSAGKSVYFDACATTAKTVNISGDYSVGDIYVTSSLYTFNLSGTLAVTGSCAPGFIENATGNGTIVFAQDSNIGSDGITSGFAGTISVTGGTLKLGEAGNDNNMAEIDMSDATFALDGGSVRYSGGNSTLGAVHFNAADSAFDIYATNKGTANLGTLTIHVVNAASGKVANFTSYWENSLHIGALTGAGSYVINNGVAGLATCRIDSITAVGGIQKLTNKADLTLGVDAGSVLNVAGTIVNTGTLGVNGTFSIGDNMAGFAMLEVGASGVLSENGTDGYLTSDTCTFLLVDNQNSDAGAVTISNLKASYKGEEIDLTYDAATGDVSFVGGPYTDTIYRVNTADIVFGETAQAAQATGFIVAEGRTVSFTDDIGVSQIAEMLKKTSGPGTVVLNLETPETELALTGADYAALNSVLDLQQGQLYLGQYNNGNGQGASVALGEAKIIVREGAALWVHLGDSDRSVPVAVDMVSGSSLNNRDGDNTISGNIRFNIVDPTAAAPAFDPAGKVILTQYWDKNNVLSGILEGDGIVEMSAPSKGWTGSWTLANNGNTFQGSYDLVDGGNGGIKLILGAENAAKNAVINLNGVNSVSTLQLNQSSVIKALNSADADNVVVANAAATLTLGEGSFAGMLKDGSAENILSLNKTGNGTLSLSGNNTYTGGTTVSGGTLEVSSENALGTGKAAIIDATLKLNSNLTVSEVNTMRSTLDMGGNTLNGKLTHSGGLSLISDAVINGPLAGTGNVTGSGAALTLCGDANTAGNVILDSLVLGSADTVSRLTANSLQTNTLTLMNLDAAPMQPGDSTPASILKLGTLSDGLTVNVSDTLLHDVLGVSYEKSLVLMELTAQTRPEVLLGAFTDGGQAASSQISTDGHYVYSLAWITGANDKQQLILQAALNANQWIGMNDFPSAPAFWTSATSWSEGTAPDADTNMAFSGYGDSQVFLNGDCSAKDIIVDNKRATGVYSLISWQGFEGNEAPAGSDKLTVSGNLEMVRGTLMLNAQVEVNGGASVSADSILVVSGAAPMMGVGTAGELIIDGAVENAGTIRNQAGASISIAGNLANTGTFISQSNLTVGTSEVPVAVSNSGDITITDSTAQLFADVENSGSISISGSSVEISGSLDNSGGTLSLNEGSLTVDGAVTSVGGAISISGEGSSLTVGEDLTLTDDTENGKGSLSVGSGTSLKVDGNLVAGNLDLEFGGSVTVGEKATINSLINNGTFTAADAEIADLIQGDEASLSVSGVLQIGSLSGGGSVNVDETGSLTINSNTDFHGALNNKGEMNFGDNEVSINAAQNAGETAGDIIANGITIADTAVGADYSLILGDVVTDKLTFNAGAAGSAPRLKLDSLTARTDGGKIQLSIDELDDLSIQVGNYHLLQLAAGMNGGLAENFDLQAYDITDTANEKMQALLQKGYWLTFSDTAPAAGAALAANELTDVYLSITEQTDAQSTWVVGDNQTAAGLVVLENGSLKSNQVLDNVRHVVVEGEQSIDLRGVIRNATLNNLTGDSLSKLDITGDAAAIDTVVLNNADYDGLVNLSGTSAEITGRIGTAGSIETGVALLNNSVANLNVVDSNVILNGGSLTGDSTMDGGNLLIKTSVADIAAGNIFVNTGDSVTVNGTNIVIVAESTDSLVLNVDGAGSHVIASIGDIRGNAADVTIVDENNNAIYAMGKYFSSVSLEGGLIIAERNTKYYTDKMGASVSANGAIGLVFADAVLQEINPQSTAPKSDLAVVLSMLDSATGAKADELGANLAGASTAVLGIAALSDVDRQLQAIRNRTTTMGVDQSVAQESMPFFNAWINAEGDRAELMDSGTESGYELNSWGGTVGFDVDFCPSVTAGLALTAMYGDLDTTGADVSTGELNSYYLTAFARYAPSAWTHTFVATVGMSDISLDRTVAGAEVKGETEGMSFGLMYEVGRVFALNEDASTCLQPVLNVSWKHTSLDAYTESGSDVALNVGEQTLDTVTVGAGARLQSVVGESMFNRTSILEARVLVKADMGDRSGSADVALTRLPGKTASVDSAEMGAFGVEAGAGLTIPMGQESGSIFMDASVELRSDYTNVNGTIGYRLNF